MKATFDMDFRAQRAEPVERSAYRRARGQDPIATLASLALVGVVGLGFATMSPIFVKKQAATPTVVTLLTEPDEPPPAEAPPPPPDALPPPPQIAIPTPIVPTIERPVQLQAPVVAAPVAEPPAPPRPAPPAPVARGPENLGEISAKMISARPPRYPVDSRRAHEEGIVVLAVLLSTDGRVQDISVARSSGFARLDRAALDAVRDWRWSPVMRDGSPVAARGLVTIPFVLQGGARDGDHRSGGHRHRDHDDDGREDGPVQNQTTA